MWDHVLNEADIIKLEMSCSAGEGNLIRMADLGKDNIKGDVKMITSDCLLRL